MAAMPRLSPVRVAKRSFVLACKACAGNGLMLELDTLARRFGRGAKAMLARAGGIAPLGFAVNLPEAVPRIDLDSVDPIPEIFAAPEFRSCVAFFATNAAIKQALVSPDTQALLFTLVRNLRPEYVIEIGTYQASTTEAVCRALCANSRGEIHTIDPFRPHHLPQILRKWPLELRDRAHFHEANSMDFYAEAMKQGLRSELIFIDGNHDFEFAHFDLECAARLLRPGGFVVVDNIGQAGPFFAVRDFLQTHPGWLECGPSGDKYRPEFPFDAHRTRISNTDVAVLRAPARLILGERPITGGEEYWKGSNIRGVSLSIAEPASGTLYAQCVVRVFAAPPTESTVENQMVCHGVQGPVELPLPWSFTERDAQWPRRAELWLSWRGDQPLELADEPRLF
jgi:predicted O-methyltransferase YrrM